MAERTNLAGRVKEAETMGARHLVPYERLAMAFIQIIEFQTSRFAEGAKYVEEYRRATEGKRTTQRVRVCQDRDNPDHYFTIAEFASYDDAMQNSELPETATLSEQLGALADAPQKFYNLEVLQDES